MRRRGRGAIEAPVSRPNLLAEWRMGARVALAAALLVAAPGVRAQEEASESTSAKKEAPQAHRLFFDLGTWVAQPAGLEYAPATRHDPNNPLATELLEIGFGTETEGRYRVGFHLPAERGTVTGTYYAHSTAGTLGARAPGQYVFGETLAHPFFAGVNNDQRADAFNAASSASLHDTRLDYSRTAFRTPAIEGRWSIGWRRVGHGRNLVATYPVLVSPLPPLLPPTGGACGNPFVQPPVACPLDPLADRAELSSSFEGRGPTGGFDVDFQLWRDRLVLESGLSLTVMRGKTSTSYASTNYLYVCDNPPLEAALLCQNGDIVGPPYDILSQAVQVGNNVVPVSSFVVQLPLKIGLSTAQQSATSQVLDVYLGFRWRARHWLDVTGGFRSSRYSDVGRDIRPELTTFSPAAAGSSVIGVEDVGEQPRSATYEGFYAGLTLRVF